MQNRSVKKQIFKCGYRALTRLAAAAWKRAAVALVFILCFSMTFTAPVHAAEKGQVHHLDTQDYCLRAGDVTVGLSELKDLDNSQKKAVIESTSAYAFYKWEIAGWMRGDPVSGSGDLSAVDWERAGSYIITVVLPPITQGVSSEISYTLKIIDDLPAEPDHPARYRVKVSYIDEKSGSSIKEDYFSDEMEEGTFFMIDDDILLPPDGYELVEIHGDRSGYITRDSGIVVICKVLKDPVDPSHEGQDPVDPSIDDPAPVDPSDGGQNPVDPSQDDPAPVDPSPGSQDPEDPSHGDQDPVDPSHGDQDPVDPSHDEPAAMDPSPGSQDPEDPSQDDHKDPAEEVKEEVGKSGGNSGKNKGNSGKTPGKGTGSGSGKNSGRPGGNFSSGKRSSSGQSAAPSAADQTIAAAENQGINPIKEHQNELNAPADETEIPEVDTRENIFETETDRTDTALSGQEGSGDTSSLSGAILPQSGKQKEKYPLWSMILAVAEGGILAVLGTLILSDLKVIVWLEERKRR